MAGQGHGEPCAPLRGFIDRAGYGDLAIMLFDYRVHQRQAQPRALAGRFSGEQRLEQAVFELLINAAALILHCQQYAMIILNRSDGDLVSITAGIPRVAHQVDQYLH